MSDGQRYATERVPLIRSRPALAGLLMILVGVGAFILYSMRDDDRPQLRVLLLGIVGVGVGAVVLLASLVRAARR